MLLTFGPYLAVVLTRWRDVQLQVGNFAGDRVPAWQPSIIWHEMTLEIGRYRGWYFGLVTSAVPNPLLWMFQAATVAGVLLLVVRLLVGQSRSHADPKGPARLLILAAGSAFIFAAFINNKVPVYIAPAAQVFARGWLCRQRNRRGAAGRDVLVPVFLSVFALAGCRVREVVFERAQSELVPYEDTVATLRALVPPGASVYGSPQFWTPFHAEPETVFYSFAEAEPHDDGDTVTLRGADSARAVVLLVDEVQWLPELAAGISQPTVAWQKNWIAFIRKRCVLDRVAFGTAHGTLAAYRCVFHGDPPADTPKLIAGSTELQASGVVLSQSAADLARWTRYDDPRRTALSQPRVDLIDQGLRISGTGWPGIIKMFTATPGDAYLVRTDTSMTRDGDLLYLGTWQEPQVQSLAGASSAGIPAPLIAEPWFPRDRAFVATAPQVRVVIYRIARDRLRRLVPRSSVYVRGRRGDCPMSAGARHHLKPSIGWDFISGAPEIMSRLTRRHRVLFVNTGVRALRCATCPVKQRIRNWWRGTGIPRRADEPLHLFAAMLPLPLLAGALINRALRARCAAGWRRSVSRDRFCRIPADAAGPRHHPGRRSRGRRSITASTIWPPARRGGRSSDRRAALPGGRPGLHDVRAIAQRAAAIRIVSICFRSANLSA
jgi:hypothetical protein